jgi:hypothetical protein
VKFAKHLIGVAVSIRGVNRRLEGVVVKRQKCKISWCFKSFLDRGRIMQRGQVVIR